MQELIVNNQIISNDGKEMISLTDLWKASGSEVSNKPIEWISSVQGKAFIDAVEMMNIKGGNSPLLKTKRGRSGGGTWAHWQIALAYAKYLNPQFHIQCNQWVKDRIEEDKNPELAIKRGRERAVKSWKKQGWSDKEIAERLKGIDMRNVFTGVLGSHEVKQKGFADCTNAIYKHLFGGPKALVNKKLGLPDKVNPRNHMNFEQLHAIHIAEGLASNKIEEEGIYGNEGCEEACVIASKIAANAVHQMRKAKLSKSLY